MAAKDDALKLVDEFAARSKTDLWLHLKRSEVAAGLRERINNPDKVNQGQTSLCGPADFVRDVAMDTPQVYARAVIDLFETGTATIGTFVIKPTKDLKFHRLPATARIHAADWIVCASVRDADNWFFDYQEESDDAAGITMPHSKASWLKQAGYRDVINDTNAVATKDLANARRASTLFSKGHKVALFINSNMLDVATQRQPSVFPDHWVALTSEIRISGLTADPASSVSMRVYSWGDQQNVPVYGALSIKDFLGNYYGFVACKL
jgi:hypothetical protein